MDAKATLQCRLCGQEHQPVMLKPGQKAVCRRCDTLLARGTRFGADAPLSFAVTGLILFVPALLLPFLGAAKLGDSRTSLLLTGVASLWRSDMHSLAILVLLCGAVIPFVLLISMLALHGPGRIGRPVLAEALFTRIESFSRRWAIPEVQVLAALVAIAKLGSLVQVSIGAGFWCYCAMTLCLLLAQDGFSFGAHVPADYAVEGSLAREAALADTPEAFARSRRTCTALAITAAVMLIPANVLPVLETSQAGRTRLDTIYSGVKGLLQDGLWPLAAIVFIASMVIPFLKLAGLTALLIQAHRGPRQDSRTATKLYAAVNFIGRWSMLDVFLGALLFGLVQFGGLATVIPHSGLLAFAAAVVLTVLATEAFDPRKLWNRRNIKPSP